MSAKASVAYRHTDLLQMLEHTAYAFAMSSVNISCTMRYREMFPFADSAGAVVTSGRTCIDK